MCKDCAKVEKKERDNRSARHVLRFSNAVAGLLLDWVRLHQDNPYPNAVEKATLQEVTGLDSKQLNTWFANYRRRRPAKKDGSVETTTRNVTSLTKNDLNAGSHLDKGSAKSGPQDVIPLVKPQQRMFQCTFCTDTFATKFEWTRHETSLHLPLKRFICCPFAPIQKSTDTGAEICAYCGLESPNPEHIASHNHDYCQSRDPDARIFLRKDHLRQHLRSVHECDMLPHMDHWLLEAVWVNSRCGFCGDRFSIWSERNEHLADHFRNGYHMGMWKGCRGLDGATSAQVTFSMPPFLIGLERTRPFPFSASNLKRKSCVPPNRSWEFLVAGLYQLVKEKSSQSRPVSDKELQDQARLLTYGSSSADINTAADHPEWLDLFKKAYSLDVLAFFTEDMAQAPAAEDLEVYHDLGISMPALSQENQAKALFALFSNDGPVPKNYLRFSASPVPLHKALPFETIAGPWPKAGILGEILVVAEWLFQKTLQSQSNFSLTFDPSETWPWLDDSEDRDLALEQMMLPWDDNLSSALGIVGEFQGIGQERFEYVD
ncbi:hypothetical protein D6C90_06497 [Aureobasidium pullulans]|uniref:Homeobox domain-containing protein n=1 Tax=Aureobasidium pullulans TaxID=5580 RepID=A0A4S9UKH1_AURPU|nr:hypothetical protein D6D04_05799 [Aureobasidium pullulans]THZ38146.1 hypothetical protein D6C90_06497 [Aureobasidium pullulans]